MTGTPTDCEALLKQGRAVANPSRAQRKKYIFCIGEVFFLLTCPLMGDAIHSGRNIIS